MSRTPTHHHIPSQGLASCKKRFLINLNLLVVSRLSIQSFVESTKHMMPISNTVMMHSLILPLSSSSN